MGKRVLALGREDKKVSTILLLPPTGGKNMPEVDRDSAVPTAASGGGVHLGVPFACGRRCGYCADCC
jgi:hypothetical protein